MPLKRVRAEMAAGGGLGHAVRAMCYNSASTTLCDPRILTHNAISSVIRLVVSEVDRPGLRGGQGLCHALEGIPGRAANGLAARGVGDVARYDHRVDARVGQEVRDGRVRVVVLADVRDEAKDVGVDSGCRQKGRGGGRTQAGP